MDRAAHAACLSRFRAREHTQGETPGVREAWHRGRKRYAVWIVRVEEACVAERALQVARALERFIVPQPRSDLHVTVWVAGFPTHAPEHDDDIAEAVLSAQAEALSKVERFSLRVTGASSFYSVPYLAVEADRGLLDEIRTRLAAHGREQRFEGYVPHVTLGRYRGSLPTAPIAEVLQGLFELPALELPVAALEWVELDAQREGSPLVTRRRVTLR